MDADGRSYYAQASTRDEYLAFHYPAGDPLAALLGAGVPPLSSRFPFAVRGLWTARPDGRALDVGAATGRVTFDLARDHRVAVGLDASAVLVAAARQVQATGRARYAAVVEGEVTDALDVAVEAAPNASFLVADALRLPFPDACFDTVCALNLIDRVPDPGQALDEVGRVTAPGGTLIVSSPYTWLERFAPKERWLGGFRRGGASVSGPDAVRTRLGPSFCCRREVRLPFFIRHHARSGQLGLAHVHVFQRNP